MVCQSQRLCVCVCACPTYVRVCRQTAATATVAAAPTAIPAIENRAITTTKSTVRWIFSVQQTQSVKIGEHTHIHMMRVFFISPFRQRFSICRPRAPVKKKRTLHHSATEYKCADNYNCINLNALTTNANGRLIDILAGVL